MRYCFSDYTLDLQRYELRCDDAVIPLRRKVFDLIVYLLTHRDRVVSRQELLDALWPDQIVSDGVLDSCLVTARRALGDSGRRQHVIKTQHGRGYRFIASVTTPAPSNGRALTEGALLPPPPDPDATASSQPTPPNATSASAAKNELSIAGEHKPVTVLVGLLYHPSPADGLDVEAQHAVWQTVFRLVLDEVARYGGTVERLLDDGFLAWFGAPVAHEDHALRASLAALGIQSHLKNDSANTEFVVAIGMGLHSGAVVVGDIDDSARMAYTAVGDTTDLGKWLARAATPGTILASPTTCQLLRGTIQLERCMPLAESSHADTAYTVLGANPQHSPLAIHGQRPLSRFVGRETDLNSLSERWQQVKDGRGQVVSIVGEPGMGKTRLLHEFHHALGCDASTYIRGRCVSYGQASPYLPLLDIVRQLCGIAVIDSAETVSGTVYRYLESIEMTAAAHAPYLLHLLGLSEHAPELKTLDPRIIRMRTFTALHALLWHASQQQPFVLEMEDLHWIDPTSDAFLQELVERLAGLPLLLLVTFRPGYQPLWMDKSYATQMALAPLSSDDSRCLVAAVVQSRELPASLLQGMLTRAAGNPFFLEELARSVDEHDAEPSSLSLPETVRTVLTARIDRLPPATKHLLQVAAVVGVEVRPSLLQAVTGQAEAELYGHLSVLQRGEFLIAARHVPEPIYNFKHALTQEAAYWSLLRSTRQHLHRRILDVFEGQEDASVAARADVLAHHAQHGQVWDKAVAYYRQAADGAGSRSAYAEAAWQCKRALAALEHLPQNRRHMELGFDLRLMLSMSLLPLMRHEQRLVCLREAERLAASFGDRQRLVRTFVLLGTTYKVLCNYEQAFAYAQRAHAMLCDIDDMALRISTIGRLGQAYYDLGDYRQAMGCFKQSIELLQDVQVDMYVIELVHPSVQSRAYLVRCLTEIGAFAEGVIIGEEALDIAERIGRPYERLAAYTRLGYLHHRQGNFPAAIALLKRAFTLSEAAHNLLFFRITRSYLAAAYACSGHTPAALALLSRMRPVKAAGGAGLGMLNMGEAYLYAGRIEEANIYARHHLQLAQKYNARGAEAWTRCLLGEIALRRDAPAMEQAAGHYRKALSLASELGMRPLMAHCHHGLGTLYRQIEQHDRARCELSAASALYREMAMTFYLQQAEDGLAACC